MREIIRTNRFRLLIAAAFMFGFVAYSLTSVSAMRLPAALASWSSKTIAPMPAAVSPALAETSSAEFADDPTAVTFSINHFCGTAGTSFDLKVGATLVTTVPGHTACVCGGGTTQTYTSTDPTVLALIGAPACTVYTVNFNGNGGYSYIGWVRVDVTRTMSGTESACLYNSSGGDCSAADLCSAGYDFMYSGTFSGGDADSDGDGVSNCTDPDIDGDAVLNGADNCPMIPNPGQEDADGNGIGDACQLALAAVPWFGNESKPHVVYSGGSLMLQASASVGGNGEPVSLVSGTWDPGDGSGPQPINVSNSRVLELAHVYVGAIGTPFTATVSVSDGAHTYTDTMKVVIAANNIETKGNMAIDHGLWNLHKNMVRVGTTQAQWPYSSYEEPSTASAVQAFEINGHRPSGDPTIDPYVANTARGLRYLLANLRSGTTSANGADNPDSNGNGIWLGPKASSGHESYIAGQVVDAIVASGTPDAVADVGIVNVSGRMFKDIVQDMLDGYANGASPTGGWEYTFSRSYDDSSASHWWAIAVLAAEQWNLDAPQWLKDRNWTGAIPNWQYFDGSNTGNDGRCGYAWIYYGETPIWDGGLNVTPACMMMMSADDKPAATTLEFKSAESFMDHNFSSTLGNMYSMYQLTKAMRTAVDGSGNPAPIELLNGTRPWFAQYTEQLVNQQSADGHWDQTAGSPGITGNLGTAWAVIILSPALFSIPPEAVCSADPSSIPTTGGLVHFSSAGSTHPDPNGSIASYEWDFGDGGTASGPDVSHTFGAHGPGVLNVTLTVTDTNGLSDTATCSPPVTVVDTNLPPNAEAGGPYTFCLGSGPFMLNGSASIDPDGSIVEYFWDFDAPLTFTGVANATTANVDVTTLFTTRGVGVYQVGLRVKDNNGQTDAEFPNVTVKAANDPSCNQAPICPAGIQSMTLSAPFSQSVFTPIIPGVTDPDGDPLTITGTSIFQDEALTGSFDATFSPLEIRKWRSADPRIPASRQTGRVYHIQYMASDGRGGSCTGQVNVCLPRVGGVCVDEGSLFNSKP